MGELSKQDIFDRWKNVNPQPPTLEEFKELLEREYRAYEFPLRFMMAMGVPEDELRAEFVSTAFVITHPAVLRRFKAEDNILNSESEESIGEPNEYLEFTQEELDDMEDEEARLTFIDDGPSPGLEEFYSPLTDETIIYYYLQDLHNAGKRVTIVVEVEDGRVVNFKQYGWADGLTRRLISLIPPLEYDESLPKDFSAMARRSLNDDVFTQYLECAYEFGVI